MTWAERVALESLLAQSDFVSLHVPLVPATRDLLSRQRIALLKPDAIVVNTARGGVLDDAALAEALAQGRVGGAGLDVFPDEPRVPEAYLRLENVVLTPHLGSGTRETRAAMARRVLEDAARVARGDCRGTRCPEREPGGSARAWRASEGAGASNRVLAGDDAVWYHRAPAEGCGAPSDGLERVAPQPREEEIGVRRIVQALVGIAISGVALWLTFRGKDVSAIAQEIRAADYRYLAPYLLILLFIHLVRTVRWGSSSSPSRSCRSPG